MPKSEIRKIIDLMKRHRKFRVKDVGFGEFRFREVLIEDILVFLRYLLGDIAIELGYDYNREKLEKEIFG